MATPKKTAPPDPSTLDETFGDEDQDLSRFKQDTAKVAPARTQNQLSREDIQRLADSADPVAELAAICQERGYVEEEASVAFSDGSIVIDKARLVQTPFKILGWRFAVSQEYGGSTFAIVRGMSEYKIHDTGNGHMFVFTDGGVGIHDLMVQYQMAEGSDGIISCPDGLKLSTYPTKDKDGNEITGKTWWIA